MLRLGNTDSFLRPRFGQRQLVLWDPSPFIVPLRFSRLQALTIGSATLHLATFP
jgi:hypothetical protein